MRFDLDAGELLTIVDARDTGIADIERKRHAVSRFQPRTVSGDVSKQQRVKFNQYRLAF